MHACTSDWNTPRRSPASMFESYMYACIDEPHLHTLPLVHSIMQSTTKSINHQALLQLAEQQLQQQSSLSCEPNLSSGHALRAVVTPACPPPHLPRELLQALHAGGTRGTPCSTRSDVEVHRGGYSPSTAALCLVLSLLIKWPCCSVEPALHVPTQPARRASKLHCNVT